MKPQALDLREDRRDEISGHGHHLLSSPCQRGLSAGVEVGGGQVAPLRQEESGFPPDDCGNDVLPLAPLDIIIHGEDDSKTIRRGEFDFKIGER